MLPPPPDVHCEPWPCEARSLPGETIFFNLCPYCICCVPTKLCFLSHFIHCYLFFQQVCGDAFRPKVHLFDQCKCTLPFRSHGHLYIQVTWSPFYSGHMVTFQFRSHGYFSIQVTWSPFNSGHMVTFPFRSPCHSINFCPVLMFTLVLRDPLYVRNSFKTCRSLMSNCFHCLNDYIKLFILPLLKQCCICMSS